MIVALIMIDETREPAVMVCYFSVMFYYYHNILFALRSNKPKFNNKTKCVIFT